MTIDGKQWGIPYNLLPWGIYTNKDAYKKAGVYRAEDLDEFVANCEKFKAAGIDCLTTGTKALWPGPASSTTCRCAPMAMSGTWT